MKVHAVIEPLKIFSQSPDSRYGVCIALDISFIFLYYKITFSFCGTYRMHFCELSVV